MKRRRKVWIAVVCFGVAVVGVLAVCLIQEAKRPVLRLEVVRQAIEHGKPLVFFRISGIDAQRGQIRITAASLVYDGMEHPIAYHWSSTLSNAVAGNEIPFFRPISVSEWKLLLKVEENRNVLGRLARMPTIYRAVRGDRDSSFSKRDAIIFAWFLTRYRFHYIESDWITNPPPAISTNAIKP